jgi:hypothetical protein
MISPGNRGLVGVPQLPVLLRGPAENWVPFVLRLRVHPGRGPIINEVTVMVALTGKRILTGLLWGSLAQYLPS